MSRLDLLNYFTPISGKLTAVEGELQAMLKSDLPVVNKLADHVRSGQGKRLRPALVLLAAKFCGAETQEDVRFGAIFELIHTATLVHDDVIDHAALRRSKPTLNVVWGNTLTVLFGDLLLVQALSCAIRSRHWRLLEILSDVTTRMIEGELIQNDCLYNPDTTRKDYFEIQERKTALLFGGCAEKRRGHGRASGIRLRRAEVLRPGGRPRLPAGGRPPGLHGHQRAARQAGPLGPPGRQADPADADPPGTGAQGKRNPSSAGSGRRGRPPRSSPGTRPRCAR